MTVYGQQLPKDTARRSGGGGWERFCTLKSWAALYTMSGGTWHCRATSKARLSLLLPGTILQVGALPPIPAPHHHYASSSQDICLLPRCNYAAVVRSPSESADGSAIELADKLVLQHCQLFCQTCCSAAAGVTAVFDNLFAAEASTAS